MIKKLFPGFLLIAVCHTMYGQTKTTENVEQVWLGYFNQARFTDKWGSWIDLHLRTKEDFTNKFSQSIIRFGLTYYITDDTKLTLGYASIRLYPGDNHKEVTQPEQRVWQQIQWHTKYGKKRMMQWFRLEERFRRKILNDSTLGEGTNFNYRLRYNFWYDIPLGSKGIVPKAFSLVLNDEVHINFGKEIINNYFDQNRFFVGLKYQFNKQSNIQLGYTNVFQQLASGNKYKSINGIRLFFFQNFDVRKKGVSNS